MVRSKRSTLVAVAERAGVQLCSEMVARGDLDELPDERFWRELEKAFEDPQPEAFFILLAEIGALREVSFFKRLFGSLCRPNP